MSVRTMIVLTLPTLGFATGLSLITTYLPVILKVILKDRPGANTLIGFAIGGEGIFSALIPIWVGIVSDRIWTKRWGRRRPFMIFAGPFMAASLMLAPFQPSYVSIAVSTFVFFAAYHFYTSPYQSLLPDVTPAGDHGKVQGYQSFMRGGGMFLGMVVAGVLFYRWKPSPFILTSILIMIFTYLTVVKIKEPEPERSLLPRRESIWVETKRVFESVRENKPIRRFMVAAFLWESTLAGLRPFIMLYFINTLGSTEQTGALLLGLVGVTYMVAGIASGYLADRFGRSRVMRVGLWVYLGGCLLGTFMNNIVWAFAFLPIFGLGGSIVLTLPYAILIKLMPKEHVGQFTGMFSMMRGLANIVAPLIAGAAIDIAGRIFTEDFHPGREYAVIWLVSGVMIAISLFFFRGGDRDDIVNA
jgi:maltose/moltooligosaccharide transporter